MTGDNDGIELEYEDGGDENDDADDDDDEADDKEDIL